MEIARENLDYGYGRRNAGLRGRGIWVNKKVVARLKPSWDLAGIKRVRKLKTSSLAGFSRRLARGSILWRICLPSTFVEILYQRGRAKAQLMLIIDHSSKLVVGYAVGDAPDTELALRAWRCAKKTLKR